MKPKGYVLAPKNVIDSRKNILYMYREKPDNTYDSGWRIFSGDESDEYVNNPHNIGMYDISTISELYPDILPYLNMPIGSVLERNANDSDFTVM